MRFQRCRPPWPVLVLVPGRLRCPGLPFVLVTAVLAALVAPAGVSLLGVSLLGVSLLGASTPTGTGVPLPVVPRGAYGWPVGPDRGGTGPPARAGEDGSVTRGFRAPPHPYGRGHRGVDLAGAPGEAVRAAGAGTVAFAGRIAGRGVVSVDHDGGLRTTYEPVSAAVTVGAPVARGSPLGVLDAGHSGCPVAACLHWGLRRAHPDGTVDYLDPLLLLGLGRVRLIPADP